MLLCHKSNCKKPATLQCLRHKAKYCEEHWTELVQDSMMHYDCEAKDHAAIDIELLSVEDKVNRLFANEEQHRLEFLKMINFGGNATSKLDDGTLYTTNAGKTEMTEPEKGRTYYWEPLPEEKDIIKYNGSIS